MEFYKLNKVFNLDRGELVKLIATGTNLNNILYSKKNGIVYQPDFDSLSVYTKEKLKSGAYKIGESKKVEGNL